MLQPDNEKSWYAFKIFFGKGKPIKAYFVTNEIEHIYDVKQEYWDKNKKKRLVKEVPIMPSLILFRSTRIEAAKTGTVCALLTTRYLARQYSTHCALRNLTAIMLRMVIIGRLTILLWAIASARSTSGSRLFAYMHLSIMPSLSPATKESTLRFQLLVWLLRTIIVTAILIPVHSPSV